jgi:DNA-binding transcriptional ArsR family regulator
MRCDHELEHRLGFTAHQGVHHSTISRYLSRLAMEGLVLKQFNEQRGNALAALHAKALNVQDLLLDQAEGSDG